MLAPRSVSRHDRPADQVPTSRPCAATGRLTRPQGRAIAFRVGRPTNSFVVFGIRVAEFDLMEGDMFDVIVVGARCAGSPTAMLLARRGYRVLLVDRATFPSDTISTHFIWQHGMACLKRWGLLDRVLATNCPPFRSFGLDLGAYQLIGEPPAADGMAAIC